MRSYEFLLGHLLSSHANFREKLAILTPWRVHACAYQTVEIDSFSENVSSVLSKWPPSSLIFISLKVWLDNRLNKHIRYFLQRLMLMTLLNSKRINGSENVQKIRFRWNMMNCKFQHCRKSVQMEFFRQFRYYQISRFSSFPVYF